VEARNEAGSLTVREAADLLGVHPETVRRLIHAGRLVGLRDGRRLRVEPSSFAELVARQRLKPSKPA
jgi:excisionase family DNA binding protein